jgi:hypothetical protein
VMPPGQDFASNWNTAQSGFCSWVIMR